MKLAGMQWHKATKPSSHCAARKSSQLIEDRSHMLSVKANAKNKDSATPAALMSVCQSTGNHLHV